MIINRIKTIILLLSLSTLFVFIGSLLGGSTGMHCAFVIALVFNGIMYFFSDKLVLRSYKAKKLAESQYPWIYDEVRLLSKKMKIPTPRLWIIETQVANAFATGRNPSNASVALTTGIVDILEPHELRGVLAHELSHIKNRDILIATLAATIASSICYLSRMSCYMGFGNSRKRGNYWGILLTAIFAPLAAMIIQLAISRSREYMADESGATYSNDPLALADALEKLHLQTQTINFEDKNTYRESTASLFIVHPFKIRCIINLFSTHPPTSARIARLRNLAEKSNGICR